MPIYATAGSVVRIGQPLAAQSADFTSSDFAAQSWVDISWVSSIGAFGDESTVITFDAIGEGRTQKLKGVRDAGNMELVCGIDYTDQGQATLRGAETETLDYAFQIEFEDMPSGGSTNSTRMFVGKVISARETLDGANNVMVLNVTIGINSNIVVVDAT